MVLFEAWQSVVPIHIHFMEESSSNILLNYYFCDSKGCMCVLVQNHLTK